MNGVALVNNLVKRFLVNKESDFKVELVLGVGSVNKADILGNSLVEYDFTYGGLDNL